MLNANKIDYVISTSEKALNALGDDIRIRRRAIEKQIPTSRLLKRLPLWPVAWHTSAL
jgi:hypothetical protein